MTINAELVLFNSLDMEVDDDFYWMAEDATNQLNTLISQWENSYHTTLGAVVMSGHYNSRYGLGSGRGGKVLFTKNDESIFTSMMNVLMPRNADCDVKLYLRNQRLYLDVLTHDGTINTVITLVSQTRVESTNASRDDEMNVALENKLTHNNTSGTKFSNKAIALV